MTEFLRVFALFFCLEEPLKLYHVKREIFLQSTPISRPWEKSLKNSIPQHNGKIIHSSAFTFVFWKFVSLKTLFWDFPLNQMLWAWVAEDSPQWTGEKETEISANHWAKT